MAKRKRLIKIDKLGQRKLRLCMGFSFILLILLVIRIGFLQFVQGASLKEQAVKNQLTSRTIEASRGTIYDSNGKALAKSASVDNIIVNPTSVKYKGGEEVNKEILAHAFSDIFGIDYNETLEKLNTKTKSFTIVSKVENDKVEKLQEWIKNNKISSGISIEGAVKRYYPYNNLASNLIGFTGTENTGRMGLEYTLNDILARHSWESFSI
ncbi:MAG: hypothetical protein J5507_01905 [Clostridia bacterium]|nr:hypothetical protein [Clostridia bacterium]